MNDTERYRMAELIARADASTDDVPNAAAWQQHVASKLDAADDLMAEGFGDVTALTAERDTLAADAGLLLSQISITATLLRQRNAALARVETLAAQVATLTAERSGNAGSASPSA